MRLSNKGKIVKLVIGKNGLVREKSQYLPIDIKVNDQHCLQTFPLKGRKWTVICSDDDYDTFGDFTDAWNLLGHGLHEPL